MPHSIDLLQASDRQHLMLLYDNESVRNSTEIDCINEALKKGQFCIYASVDVQDKDFMSKFASRIQDYDRHVTEGNLLIINFMPFYTSATKSDLSLFENLKKRIESTLRDRIASEKNGKTLVFADAACNLTRHKKFAESVALESWWQGTYLEWAKSNLDITIICAHPSTVLEHHAHAEKRTHISRVHSLTIDLRELARPITKNGAQVYNNKPVEARPIRVLVAEPDSDIQQVYWAYFRSLPVEAVVVSDGKKCLEQALAQDDGRENFDMVIIDSHLENLGWIEVAKKILEENPSSNIILTTTQDQEAILSQLESAEVSFNADAARILVKPFRFSQLLSLIKCPKSDLN